MTDRGSSRDTARKRSGGTLVFGVFWTLFSSIFLIIGLKMIWDTIRVGGWDKVPCEIERFEILADKDDDPPFRADLLYRYEVDGRRFTGTRLWPEREGSDDFEDLSELREMLARGPEGPMASPAGVATECRVNPDDPAESSLFAHGWGDLAGGVVFALFGGFFVLIGIGPVVGGVMSKKAPAKSGGSAEEAPPFVAVIALLFFGVAGLGLLGGMVLPKALEWAAMRGWQEADAEVIWSRVTRHSDSDGTTYAVDLFYRYHFEGKEYRANRYDLIGGSSSGAKGKHQVVRAHPRGSTLRVHVDPDRPWRAVVKRDAGWAALFALFPLPFLVIGFGGLGWMWRQRNEGRSVSGRQPGRAPRARRSPTPVVADQWIKVGGGRWAAFAGFAIFALFWNGITSLGVRDALDGLMGESVVERIFGGGFGLFMIPFVLVGIGLAGGALYFFAALFAPRYEVKLGGERLVPGSSTGLRWRRAGGRGQPRDFTLLLVGREEVVDTEDSNRSKSRSIFHEQVLFETTIRLAMAPGRAELRIPEDGVPSFHGKHHKIRWLLCLRATVPGLPDLNEEREITVHAPQKDELP